MSEPRDGSLPSGLAGTGFLRGVVVYARTERSGATRLLRIAGDVEGVLGRLLAAVRDAGTGWAGYIHPDDRERVEEAWQAVEPGEEGSVEYRIGGPGEETRWVRDTFQLQERAEGPVWLGSLLDVDAERRLRERVEVLEGRIWRAQRLDSLGTLAAGVAHDLNNLLTTILGTVDFLEEEELSSVARSDLGLIRKTARHGARMVRQVLEFARRGEESRSRDRIDLSRCLQDLHGILARIAGEEVRLRCRIDEDLPPIRGDVPQLEQVFLNLVVNARDAMPEGGEIEIRARSEAGDAGSGSEQVVVEVRDTGPGIPRELRERIFEPFFTTKADGEGGLGLSTVERIVRGLRGELSVSGGEGQGATFTIRLPAAAGAATPLPEVTTPEAVPSGLRVLLVEPDASVRELLTRMLGELGHRVMATERADEGLQLFDRIRPRFDFLVAGSLLPDRSGAELVQALRRRIEDLPAVMVAPEDSAPRDPEALPRGVLFLRTPFTVRELRSAMGGAAQGLRGEARGEGPDAGARSADGV